MSDRKSFVMSRLSFTIAKVAATGFIIIISILLSCTQAIAATDMVGRQVALKYPVERIVSLAPSCTEIIIGLGLAEKLAGITEHTEEFAAELNVPIVGSYVNLNVEAIASVNPDLVLATNDGNPEEVLEKLRKLSIPVFVLDLTTYDNIRKSILAVGSMLGREARGSALSNEMQKAAECIRSRTGNSRITRVLFVYDSYPIVTTGTGTFTDELIRMSGGMSVTSDVKIPYPRLTIEHVIARNPDAIVISSMDPHTDRDVELRWWKQWKMLSAVKNDRVFVLPSKNLDRPSHLILNGFRQLAAALHPELFKNNECQ